MSSLTIHVFECGQGDTILLRLGDKWALIDCNLPVGVPLESFFERVDLLGVRRLDVICLTHPHDDHCRGMRAIIEHFTSDGRTIGYFCDGGLDPRLVASILKTRTTGSAIASYTRLYKTIFDLNAQKKLAYYRCDRNTRPVLTAAQDCSLFPIGPTPDVIHMAAVDTLEAAKLSGDLNELSLILLLQVSDGSSSTDVLLAGDTDGNHLNDALLHLQTTRGSSLSDCRIDILKVPHHGSLASHENSVVGKRIKQKRTSLAVIPLERALQFCLIVRLLMTT